MNKDEIINELVDRYLDRPEAQHGDPELAREEVSFVLSEFGILAASQDSPFHADREVVMYLYRVEHPPT